MNQGKGLTLRMDKDGRKLHAIYLPAERTEPIDVAWLREQIAAQGFSKLYFEERFLTSVVHAYNHARDAFDLVVGEVRDGQCSIFLDSGKMAAHLTITPPYAGEAVTQEDVLRALEQKGIVSGVLFDSVNAAVAAERADNVLIAAGRAAQHGQDGYLQNLLPSAKERRPKVDVFGKADYRDLGEIPVVQEGDALMRKIPPTLGEPGETVLGQVIPATPGKQAMFAANLSGTRVSSADPDLLLAAITGQPVMVSNGVKVEPTFVVRTVTVASGNIDFDGTVKVLEDVQSGMLIRATGDVHIGGTVEMATIDAGGDIVVAGGVVGRSDQRGELDESTASLIQCSGSFSARFVQNARIQASNSIYVDDVVMQSHLAAGNQVIVGKSPANKGCIMGGLTQAALLVQAFVLGAPAYPRTRVEVGVTPRVHDRLRELAVEQEEKEKQRDDVQRLLETLRQNPERAVPGMDEKAEKTLQAIMAGLAALKEEQGYLMQEIELSQGARVVAEKAIYTAVEIQVGLKVMQITEDRRGAVFVVKDGELETF
ncbi:MAG: FapA family protein [Sulfuricellaceae bacterium]|nr:FapA family protein [Sulfuricellaceae bacterium]